MGKKAGKAMTKGAIADSLATEFEIKKGVASKIIDSLSDLASKEVKSAGIFTFPGLPHQDSRQAGHQGMHQGDLRQDAACEGQARSHHRQGIPSRSFEEQHLSLQSRFVLSILRGLLAGLIVQRGSRL